MSEPTFDAIDGTRPYNSGYRGVNRHYGQRKLALDEIDFLTRVVKPGVCTYVLYIGASPGIKTAYVASLFPRVRMLCVDPCDFAIKPHPGVTITTVDPGLCNLTADVITAHNITCLQAYMTTKLIEQIKPLAPQWFLISDARTACYNDEPQDSDICYNFAQQYNWIRALEPQLSILKFRHPFHEQDPREFRRETNSILMQSEFRPAREAGLDIIADYHTKTLTFFDGELTLQPWSPNLSTEVRLLTSGKTLRNWGDHLTYEGKMFYYNTSIRRGVEFQTEPIPHMCKCADCALEQSIWRRYLVSTPGTTMTECVEGLSNAIDRRMHA